jgi:hypothetical protein
LSWSLKGVQCNLDGSDRTKKEIVFLPRCQDIDKSAFVEPDEAASAFAEASGLQWRKIGDQKPSGLTWRKIGDEKPGTGKELKSMSLAEALELKTKFTQEQWHAFDITALRMDHFIKSGVSYFQPAEKPRRGTELTNAELAKALASKSEFTQKQWDKFNITDLHVDHFIEGLLTSGVSYFQPTGAKEPRRVNVLSYGWRACKGAPTRDCIGSMRPVL